MEYLHCLQINWPKCCTGAIFVCMLNYITANTVHSDFKCICWYTVVAHNNTHTIANYSVSSCMHVVVPTIIYVWTHLLTWVCIYTNKYTI